MGINCKYCKEEMSDLIFYPHLLENLFKPNIDLSTLSEEITEDIIRPHLHTYYKCNKCHYINSVYESPLLTDKEVQYLQKQHEHVNIKRTVSYWREWLKNNKK